MVGGTMELAHFTALDYIIFSMMLAASLGIGIYHGIKSNKTTEDFLLASRSLSPVPVAFSLIATFISSISILGYVGEVYGYGIQLYWLIPGIVAALLLTTLVVLPVFYDLKMSSINQYMVLRFKSPALKYLILIVSCLKELLYLGICLYAPTLALAAVTPISSNTYILIMGTVVTLYSSVGGLKAVVWTDFFQTVIILLGVLLTTLSSMSTAGGLTNVLHIARESERLEAFDMRFGLHERHTATNTFIMGVVTFGYVFAFSQSTLQRITTQASLRNAQAVMYGNTVGLWVILTTIFLGGVCVYAVYNGCDPISLGLIEKRDQILPFYVMHHLGFLKGVPGVFVACLFSGTLSSISSVLNSLPTMLWVDLLSDLQYFQRASERSKTIFNKLLTMSLGIVMMGLAFGASKTKGLIQASITVSAVVAGPIAGVFVMGIAIPIVAKKGALAGFLVSSGFMFWIAVGAQLYGADTPMLPLHTQLCELQDSNLTLASNISFEALKTSTSETFAPLHALYDISYTMYGLIGLLLCLFVGLAVTYVTGPQNLKEVEPEHVILCLRHKVGPEASPNHTGKYFLANTSAVDAVDLNEEDRPSSSLKSFRNTDRSQVAEY